MNWNRNLLGIALSATFLAGSALTVPAIAHPHVGVGVYVGPGFWGAPYYWGGPYYWPGAGPYPYYYGPQTVIVQPQDPGVYVQQPEGGQIAPAAPAASAPPAVWYHCSNPEGYYPYVKQCTTPWQPVAATPPASTQR